MDNLDHHLEKPIADGTLESIVACATGWCPSMRVGNDDNIDHNEFLITNPQDPYHYNNSIIAAPSGPQDPYNCNNSIIAAPSGSTMTDTCSNVLTCNNAGEQSMDMKLSSARLLQTYDMEFVHGRGREESSGNGGDEVYVAVPGSSTWHKGRTSGDIHHKREAESTKEADKKNKKRCTKTISSAMKLHQHQSECRREDDEIHQRIKTLQNLVPNTISKIDRVSILDEVIKYIKQLQTQGQIMTMMMMMRQINTVPYPMMHYAATIPQMQMSMMPQMGCHPTLNASTTGHPISSMLMPRSAPYNACEYQRPISPYDFHPSHPVPQPVTVEAYNRMAFDHQLHQSRPPPAFSTP